jgi:hypothetical protein
MKRKYMEITDGTSQKSENESDYPDEERSTVIKEHNSEQTKRILSFFQNDFKTAFTNAMYSRMKAFMFIVFLILVVVIILAILNFSGKLHFGDPPVNKFLDTIRGPSFYKNETIRVRDQYWNQILNRNKLYEDQNVANILIGIVISAGDFQRRQFIRTLQIKPYNDYKIHFKFVLGNPTLLHQRSVKYENDTYGDIIVLEHIGDTRATGRTLKSYEFYRYVEKNLPQYTHIGRMDSDCFLNVADFWDLYMNETVLKSDTTIIAAYVDSYFKGKLGKFDWPQGSFYTMTRDLMLIINKFHELVPKMVVEEDCQLAWYLFDAEIDYTKVQLDTSRNYDFNGGLPGWTHNVYNNTIKVHELKTDEEYLAVANCFDEKGVNTTMINLMRDANWALPHD